MTPPQTPPVAKRSYPAGVLLVVSAVYTLLLSAHLSSLRLMWIDEFHAWSLLSDPSTAHALRSWSEGADSGGPLFYALGRLLLAITGPSPLAIRLMMATFLWAAWALWWKVLRDCFSFASASFAVALVWLCTPMFAIYMAEVRAYPLYLLCASATLGAVPWSEKRTLKPPAAFALFFALNAALVCSHALGVIFSGIACVALLLSRRPPALRAWAITGCLAAWPLLLLTRKNMAATSTFVGWIPMPQVRDLVRFYFHLPTAFKLLNLALFVGCVAVMAARRRMLLDSLQTNGARRLTVVLSAMLMMTPVLYFALSHLLKPVLVDRYAIPYFLGLASFGACAFWLGETALPRGGSPLKVVAFAAAAGMILWLHIHTIRNTPVRPPATIEPLLALRFKEPMVVEEINVFMEMNFYAKGQHGPYVYTIPDTPGGLTGRESLAVLMRHGYAPGLMSDATLLENTTAFVYVDFHQGYNQFQVRVLDTHPEWVGTPIGTVELHGIPLVPDGPHALIRYVRK